MHIYRPVNVDTCFHIKVISSNDIMCKRYKYLFDYLEHFDFASYYFTSFNESKKFNEKYNNA